MSNDGLRLDISDDTIRSLVSEALFKTLDEGKRELLVREAIKHLITPQKSGYYGEGKSPLQAAFYTAIEQTATTMLHQMMDKDETVRNKLKSVVSEAFDQVFNDTTEYHSLVKEVARAIANSLKVKY